MRIRVVVADQSEAKFYELGHRPESLKLVGQLLDPQAHLHDRDFNSDRPGRMFDHAPMSGGRRGATPHHATGGEHGPRRHEAEQFARRIAAELERGQRNRDFDGLIILAGPLFLGLLRSAFSDAVRSIVVAEVTKDLVHQSTREVIKHLPPRPYGATA
jgi:protein required for attachment to host cells